MKNERRSKKSRERGKNERSNIDEQLEEKNIKRETVRNKERETFETRDGRKLDKYYFVLPPKDLEDLLNYFAKQPWIVSDKFMKTLTNLERGMRIDFEKLKKK